jgi:hypothetical protein
MNKIYAIIQDYYMGGILANVRVLGYVATESEAQKILEELDNDDVYYKEVEYYGK